MTRRVFITGMGCLSGLAQGASATWAALLERRDTLRPFDLRLGEAPHLAATGMGMWMDRGHCAFNFTAPVALTPEMVAGLEVRRVADQAALPMAVAGTCKAA